MIITSVQQLKSWLDEANKRHRSTDDGCTCGWNPSSVNAPNYITWDEHFATITVDEIADVIPSRTWDGERVSCSQIENDLYRCIDALHEVIDWWERTAEHLITNDQRDEYDAMWQAKFPARNPDALGVSVVVERP